MHVANSVAALQPDIASLPMGEWLKAPAVFGWLAYGAVDTAQQLYAEVHDADLVGLTVWARNLKTPAIERLERLEAKCDEILAHLRVGALRAYLWRAGEMDPIAVSSNRFFGELTIGVFDGKLRRIPVRWPKDSHDSSAHPDLKTAEAEGLKSVEDLKAAGLTGEIWFRRADVVALFEAQTSGNQSLEKGFLFLDEAVGLIRIRTNMPEGPAVKALLDVIVSTDVRLWKRTYGSESAVTQTAVLESVEIDLNEFRSLGHSGLRIGGAVYHLHRFVLSEDDFQYWLDEKLLAQPPSTDEAPIPDRHELEAPAASALREASNTVIASEITKLYGEHKARHEPAPNVKQTGEIVHSRLCQSGYRAAKHRIVNLAGDPKFGGQRRKQGQRKQ